MSQSESPDITVKVQLHVHLDGSPRLSSILPLVRKRGINFPVSTEEELKKAVVMTNPETLTTFLKKLTTYALPAYTGCLDAVRQLAAEFAEDIAADNIIYTEARFCPHLLIGDSELTPDEIVEAVCDEFGKAEKKFNIKLRSILCCIRSMPDISLDIVRLCEKFKDKGVVAIDIAGDENQTENGAPTDDLHFKAFKLAKEKNIYRTVHAGENGSAAVIKEAVDKLFANRIGHGYRVLPDKELYDRLKAERMHFECCPCSSVFTGACEPDFSKHPIKTFAKDGFSFSINTDDTIVTGTTLNDEFAIVETKIGVNKERLIQTIFDGAENAFLSDEDKRDLLMRLSSAYGPRNSKQ
ncbi:adenosine deaminase-like [Watersipora subatra]|uniref:adenosine deaminase-like n=1 Tax=Watersipora subatra TaxID=2589382 RepID=UPI00355B9A98